MGLGLSPFVVAGARDQMRADEQMEWAREDQQFRREQRARETKRAAAADELFADQIADYRDERAFARGMRDITAQNAGSSRLDFTTALEDFARRNGRVELADKFRTDRENGHLDVMKRVVMAASTGADPTRLASILNEGRPTNERIDPAAITVQRDANGRASALVLRGPQGQPVPIDLNEWGLMTGLRKPQKLDIKDNVMTVQNGDGSQSVLRLVDGRLVWEKNPNHVPDPERGPGRGGAGGGAGSSAGGGSGGGATTQIQFEKAIDEFIKDMPGMVERDPVSGQMRGLTARGLEVRSRAATLLAGARQGALTNGRAGEARPVPFDSPLAAIRIANDPSGQWKDVEVNNGGRTQRMTAWVINDAASGGEVAYFPSRPIARDVDQNEVVLRTLRQSANFPKIIDEVRRLADTPNAEALLDEEFRMPGAGRALLSYVRDLQRPQDEQTMPAPQPGRGMQPPPAQPAAPGRASSGAVGRAIARGVRGFLDNGPTEAMRSGAPAPGAPVPIPEEESAFAFGPDTNPRFRGGPQGTPPEVPRDWRAGIPR